MMKKKLITTSLATSLLVGSVAGLPLSAYASATTPLPSSAATLKTTLNEIYAELSSADKEVISSARDSVLALGNNLSWVDGVPSAETAAKLALINPIWNQILAKIHATPGYNDKDFYGEVTKGNIFLLGIHLAINTIRITKHWKPCEPQLTSDL